MAGLDLAGKVAFVTGGSSGIGAACCRLLTQRGAAVVVADINGNAAAALAAEISTADAPAIGVPMDVTDPASVDRAFDEANCRFGRLDIGVNSAGTGIAGKKTGDFPLADWNQVISVNLTGVFLSMQGQIAAMRKTGGGSIVNIASVLSMVASSAGSVPYIASKHGLIGLTKAAAIDHAPDGIRVNAVGPGYLDTPLLRSALQPEQIQARESLHVLNRLGRPEEVAELVAWLASDAASFATGSFYPIDGGYLAR